MSSAFKVDGFEVHCLYPMSSVHNYEFLVCFLAYILLFLIEYYSIFIEKFLVGLINYIF